MHHKPEKQRVFQEQRLRHHLEVKSRQIERVFDRHQLPVQVSGGRVASRGIQFDLQTSLAAGKEMLRGISQELMGVMGVADLRFSKSNGRWQLHVKRVEDVPVPLLDLLPMLDDLGPVTAVLGIGEDGNPIVLDFNQDDVSHVLIAGDTGAGKSALLQSIILSLAWHNRQSQLQMVVIAPSAESGEPNDRLQPLSFLPHMLAPITADIRESVDILNFLATEVEYRLSQENGTPTIMVFIDDLDLLLAQGGEPVVDVLGVLAQSGAAANIHLLGVVGNMKEPLLDELFLSYLPLRIVGQLADAEEARKAADVLDNQAELLLGGGDFLVVAGELVTRFQAAYVDAYDLHLCLERLHRVRRQALLARPVSGRLHIRNGGGTAVSPAVPQSFVFDGTGVSLSSAMWQENEDDDILFDVREDARTLLTVDEDDADFLFLSEEE